MESLYELAADFLPPGAKVISFEGEEALNRAYRFRILFRVPLALGLSLDLDGAIGHTARFSILRAHAGGPRATYSGTVATLELVEDLEHVSLLRLHLVPKLWRLGLGEHSRVFVGMSLPDVLALTLKDGGLTSSDYELRLTAKYPSLAFVCQFRESRLTFLTRWLERVGAYYFFEQGPQGEKLVIVDSKAGQWPCQDAPVRFAQHQSNVAHQEALQSFCWRHEMLPRKVAVADYTLLNPSLKVSGAADVVPESLGGEVSLFKVNEEVPDRAQSYADTRAREYLAQGVSCRAGGRVFGLAPGFTFDLAEHPRSELNRRYLITEAKHRGAASTSIAADLSIRDGAASGSKPQPPASAFHDGAASGPKPLPTASAFHDGAASGPKPQPPASASHDGGASAPIPQPTASASSEQDRAQIHEDYHCDITAVPADEHWLSPAATPWPRIAGTVRARIDGEADSAFAQLDEHGRYLVRLMLDESGLTDGAASARIRMLQAHAGNPEGMHLPLRKGTEVQIGFLRGDPDQPVISGIVPNTLQPSLVTQANRTQNVIQTGGMNRLEMDDSRGSQYIDLSSPSASTFLHLGAHAGLGTHNYVLSTGGDASMHTGGRRDIQVGGDQTETVHGDVNENYHGTQTTTVDGALTETIDGGATQTIHAGSTQTIDGGQTQTISGGEIRCVTGGQTETLSGGRSQFITGSSAETVNGDITQTIGGGSTITSPAGHTVYATGGFELSTPGSITLIANGGFNLLAPGGQTRLDDDYTQSGGQYKIFAENQIVTAVNRVDLRGGYFEFIGFKMDGYGYKLTQGGESRQTAAISLGAGPARITTRATFFHKGALKLWGM